MPTISTSKANHWCTDSAREIASQISTINRLYCGPAVVGWIAAVWNIDVKKRQYDYMERLNDKDLFPDGPRAFKSQADLPFVDVFQSSLHTILKRETNNELGLTGDTMYRYGTIHDELEDHDLPIIIRMYPDQAGLHYVTLYKSEKKDVRASITRPIAPDRIKFYWQDNGLYGRRNGGNGALYGTPWKDVQQHTFSFGAQRVKKM
jgi:hypothetical protein